MEGSSGSSEATVVVPSVAVRWIVYNSTSTNVELAAYSNISRAWREIVVECLDEIIGDEPESSAFATLLLPSWIRHFCASRSNLASFGQTHKHEETKDDIEKKDTYCVAWFHPDGIRSKTLTPRNSSPKAAGIRVLYQWDGYREAIDVLSPFGYSNSLIRNVIEKAQRRIRGDSSDSKPASNDNNSHRDDTDISLSISDRGQSSVAVRGAIYARPEGYGQSWDKLDAHQFLDQKNETLTIQRPLCKKELEPLVLPKVLWRNHNEKGSLETDKVPLPFVQFLNMDSSHAIRLLTPRFEKPVFTPITVFCVAIATEDGCFFSGLKEELACGHMYPTLHSEVICEDRSPICLNANYTERPSFPYQDESEQVAIGNEHCLPDHIHNSYLGPVSEFLNPTITEESDSDSRSSDDSGDAEGAVNAVCGQLGPGTWHCYTVVFDGNQSIIRIDGEEETTTSTSTIPSSFQACLDGITIGSDQSFDMSLCFGQGSDGEGEGAIAELAFFKGRMSTRDITSLESHLMAKHEIPVDLKTRNERINEDYLSRYAHKLMNQSPARAGRIIDTDFSVPLRYMTELPHVAWKQRNKVTGRHRLINRIGSKSRNGSASEW